MFIDDTYYLTQKSQLALHSANAWTEGNESHSLSVYFKAYVSMDNNCNNTEGAMWQLLQLMGNFFIRTHVNELVQTPHMHTVQHTTE